MGIQTIERRQPGAAARVPVQDLLHALLDGDESRATELAHRVLRERGSRTSVFADLLFPAQVEVANLWHLGRVGYADEVRVAEAVRRIVVGLPPTPVARPVPRGARCVLAVPHEDPHDLGLLTLGGTLQDEGWTAQVLGPTTRLGDAVEAVAESRPRFFGLSAACPPPLAAVEQAIAAVQKLGVPVLVGGVAFSRRPDLWRRVGASGFAPDVRVAAVLARRSATR